ncbi:MAG: hypothetical protein AAGA48_21180 [Myxococcota bacterium]
MFGWFDVVRIVVQLFRTEAAFASTKDDDGNCVACGSIEVYQHGDKRICHACGYEGRADGGGPLTRDELRSLYDDDTGLFS